MIRLAYICADPGVDVFGSKGASIHVQEVVRALREEGVDVTLFATRCATTPPDDLGGIPVVRLPHPRGQGAEREFCSLEANPALREALLERGPFDVVYERHSIWSHAAIELAAELGVPGLLEVNAPLLDEQRRFRSLVLHEEAASSVARALRSASACVAVSEPVAAYLRDHPATHGAVCVIPNGVDPQRFDPGHRRESGGDAVTVGFVGSLKPWHDLPTLVAAFAELHGRRPDTRLLVVGDGPGRDELHGALAEHGLLEAASITGMIAPADVPAALASIDVAVAPYPALEPFYFSPLKVLEYMAMARPIVAASIGQVGDLIQPEVNGLLYAPGSPDELAAALGRLVDDDGLRRTLGERARRDAIERHSWRSVVRRILELASSCQSGAAVPGST
jgi:glycosyltransferase involved in cell wall biosynthesis